MSLSPGIGSCSHQNPVFLSSGEQQVFTQQSRLLLPSHEQPFTQKRRYLLPTPIHQPFAQRRRNFLPPFRVTHPFIQHNKNRAHLWRNRINVYPSPRHSWHHPSMRRNLEGQFAIRKRLFPTKMKTWKHSVQPSFSGHQTFSNVVKEKILPIDFVRCEDQESQDDIIQEENYTYQSDAIISFGEWEKHTKGIGTKLLFKMGFKPGKGLGKSLQGRIQLLEATELNGKLAIGSDPLLEQSYPAQQSVYRCQSSNDLRSPSSYRIAITPIPEVICISSSDEEDYLILDDDEYLPEVPSQVCHASVKASLMQTSNKKKSLSEWPWNSETSCSSTPDSRISRITNSPFETSSVMSAGSPDVVYIFSSDEDECVVLYDNSHRQR